MTHLKKVISTIYNEIKTTYKEQGLIFGIGYILPEIASYIVGVGEVKSLSKVEKIEYISEIGRYTGEMIEIARVVDNIEDLAKAYPNLNIPEGYEGYHTGRTEFENNINGITALDEKLAMEEIMDNPNYGDEIISELKDFNLHHH